MVYKLVQALRDADPQDDPVVVLAVVKGLLSSLPATVAVKRHEDILEQNGLCYVQELEHLTLDELRGCGIVLGEAKMILRKLREEEPSVRAEPAQKHSELEEGQDEDQDDDEDEEEGQDAGNVECDDLLNPPVPTTPPGVSKQGKKGKYRSRETKGPERNYPGSSKLCDCKEDAITHRLQFLAAKKVRAAEKAWADECSNNAIRKLTENLKGLSIFNSIHHDTPMTLHHYT